MVEGGDVVKGEGEVLELGTSCQEVVRLYCVHLGSFEHKRL